MTSEGQRHLCVVVGTNEFRNKCVTKIVRSRVHQIQILSKIARFYPQPAYCVFTAGFSEAAD